MLVHRRIVGGGHIAADYHLEPRSYAQEGRRPGTGDDGLASVAETLSGLTAAARAGSLDDTAVPRITDAIIAEGRYELVRAPDHAQTRAWHVLVGGRLAGLVRPPGAESAADPAGNRSTPPEPRCAPPGSAGPPSRECPPRWFRSREATAVVRRERPHRCIRDIDVREF
jgi:hypothetical protein